jgi:hypothetical protein
MRARLMSMLTLAALLGCDHTAREAPSSSAAVFVSHQRERLSRATSLYEGEEVRDDSASTALPATITNMVIRTATASIEVDSLEPAIARVKELALRVGGYLANSATSAGKNQLRQASLVMKVPAARFDDVMSGLTPIGRLESANVSSQDVGEEYVDVTARMENARRLERRLIDLLATRTGKLKDVLDVEQELARVREQIERHEGRLRYLRAYTAMSTLTIGVHEPIPIVATAGRGVMGEAFRQAWRNLVALVAFGVSALGIVIPLGSLALLVWFVARRGRRVFTQRTA